METISLIVSGMPGYVLVNDDVLKPKEIGRETKDWDFDDNVQLMRTGINNYLQTY